MKHLKLFENFQDIESIYDKLSEILYFRNNTHIEFDRKLMNDINYFIMIQLDRDYDLNPITRDEYIEFRKALLLLESDIENDVKLFEKLSLLYDRVRERMKGFPKFYEIEDILLEIIEDYSCFAWYEFKVGHAHPKPSLIVDVTKGGLNVTDYNIILMKCRKLIPRIESLCDNNVEIIETEYDKRESNVKIELTIK